MSNEEVVRTLFDSFPQVQGLLREGRLPMEGFLAEDVEWDSSEMALPDAPAESFHGREGVRQFWMTWLAGWEDIAFDYELRSAGEKVVALIDQRMSASSELDLPTVTYAQVFTFRDGKVVHWKLHVDQDEALRAAGVGSPAVD